MRRGYATQLDNYLEMQSYRFSSFTFILALLLILDAALVSALDLSGSSWIWTTEYNAASGAPAGSRAFRKTLTAPAGKIAIYADIIITTDNFYLLYVNGASVGSRTNTNDWQQAGRFCIGLSPTTNVIAVNGTNESIGRAGVLAAVQVFYTDGTSSTAVTDVSWKAITSLPTGFQAVTFNDASWAAAVISGTYGAFPYAPIPVPGTSSICARSCIAT
ncbi:hypothetical protein B0H34DRAFT_733295 [Crassisporium funariophilum]|nr:hypothetical protein B0H34DRAFT_733295 [Crassisporium funariophilum]